jgi:hypothetical protein
LRSNLRVAHLTRGDKAIRYRRAMKSSDDRKRKYFALMERYNQLGRLLPTPGDLDTDDAAAVAEARLILAEMNATQAKMDALSKRRRQ